MIDRGTKRTRAAAESEWSSSGWVKSEQPIVSSVLNIATKSLDAIEIVQLKKAPDSSGAAYNFANQLLPIRPALPHAVLIAP